MIETKENFSRELVTDTKKKLNSSKGEITRLHTQIKKLEKDL